MAHLYAIIDCNNFYVSCERVFNPKILNLPVVVLSNNDGCVIARSNEAKVLGIPMGAPYYQYKSLLLANNVKVLSSNYSLYGDMSKRVMLCITSLVKDIEVYSIDEAFIKLDASEIDMLYLIKNQVLQCTGISVSIGVAKTKTLAKLANKVAKQNNLGVVNFTEEANLNVAYNFNVSEIWGISKRYQSHLAKAGVNTIFDFKYANQHLIKSIGDVNLLRTFYEIQGNSCLDLKVPDAKKSIVVAKSFITETSSLDKIKQHLSSYVSQACFKLRKQKSKALSVKVFIQTSRFKQEKLYFKKITVNLPYPSSNTPYMLRVCFNMLQKIYKKGYEYKKCGVILSNIITNNEQLDAFCDNAKNDQLMLVIDQVNKQFGSNSLRYASTGKIKKFCSAKMSPRYTTCWAELVKVS